MTLPTYHFSVDRCDLGQVEIQECQFMRSMIFFVITHKMQSKDIDEVVLDT
jgi:hypothetical protein